MFSEMPALLFETPLSTQARKKAKTKKPRTPNSGKTEKQQTMAAVLNRKNLFTQVKPI